MDTLTYFLGSLLWWFFFPLENKGINQKLSMVHTINASANARTGFCCSLSFAFLQVSHLKNARPNAIANTRNGNFPPFLCLHLRLCFKHRNHCKRNTQAISCICFCTCIARVNHALVNEAWITLRSVERQWGLFSLPLPAWSSSSVTLIIHMLYKSCYSIWLPSNLYLLPAKVLFQVNVKAQLFDNLQYKTIIAQQVKWGLNKQIKGLVSVENSNWHTLPFSKADHLVF